MKDNLEECIVEEGMAIFNAIRSESENLFDKNYWLGRVMDYVMKDPSFKVDMFRFVDVLPMLHKSDQVARHMEEYLVKKDREIPALMNISLKAASFSIAQGLVSSAIKKNVTDMAERFIAAVDITGAEKALTKLKKEGFFFTIDLLGEKTLSEQDADSYLTRYLELIALLPKILKTDDDKSPIHCNVSIKISALSCRLHEEDPDYSVADAKRRVLMLLEEARKNHVFINFDVENFQTNEIIYQLFADVSQEFRSWPHLGIVVQAYLKNSEQNLNRMIGIAQQRKQPITIRLVKGAYWDYEVVKAENAGHVTPVFIEKARTDQNFEHLSKILLDHCDVVRPAFGSHNIRSLAHAIAYAKSRSIDENRYEIQMLYGMAEGERRALKDRGHHVRIYMPIGEMLPGMSYLVRRLLENTSQMGFLKLSHHDRKNEESLLLAPVSEDAPEPIKQEEFTNCPHADFTDKDVRERFLQATNDVKKKLPLPVHVMIGGVLKNNRDKMEWFSPNDMRLKVAHCDLANIDDAKEAIEMCMETEQPMPALLDRIDHVDKLANILLEDRFFLSAIMCFLVGKTWAEADADVAEAIDFCRYYASRAKIELAPQKMGNKSGEHNMLTFQPRGPTAIIAPWNFPIAILCGMSVGAYLGGNPIIMKPAEQSMLIAFCLYERMLKASFSNKSVHFLPGIGESIGPYLVSHPGIATIGFTGSMKVGHEIMGTANTVVAGQRQMKRVVCEMGGKNAIIVDDDADLDEAVQGVLKSAFIYAGQKCSAASRVIVVGSIKEQFVPRLAAATLSMKVGSSVEPSTFMGPVIDQEAADRLNDKIKKLSSDSSIKMVALGEKISGGHFVPAAVVEVSDASHWVMQEELFGPILAVYHASNLPEAIKIANNTRYALTGAIFSRSPKNIAYAKEHFQVGNLYINQKCTGALVFRQPFGGFKMSGTGIKAGGPHYLLNFVDTKLVSENTMRRGFTPEVSV